MFRGTKGIIGNDLDIEIIINALKELGFHPDLKHSYRDEEHMGMGDAIITIRDKQDGIRELFVLWNYQDFSHVCPNPKRTILNLAFWGNSITIIESIIKQLNGGYLIKDDKKDDWQFVN